MEVKVKSSPKNQKTKKREIRAAALIMKIIMMSERYENDNYNRSLMTLMALLSLTGVGRPAAPSLVC